MEHGSRIRRVRTPRGVAPCVAVMLGGFGWLSGQISRMGARVDAVSLKVTETPGLFQRELQAQTEKLTALINADRQSQHVSLHQNSVL